MKYFIVDAFAEKAFEGNQAGGCLVDRPIDEKTMQAIAAENNLSETAFITRNGETYDLRWFTPEVEINLCGHATLIPFRSERPNKQKMVARQLSKRGGILYCEDNGSRVKIAGKTVLYLSGHISI